ncbi:uncharacterized protein BDR25DRAFT_114074 [Lindgomyces ingoldianus]|uniref:Uncharacterized protein n=1 Tax=Lindgomyces ingoldianus TaxID=673940 RepID=A0ACB6Q8Y3_9PLEO|nr:uncharacterized protein BDR25DRAFT_114074 [Lindgomyces ingoldianus]KAF2463350.1 hypothetical protein BDR25DRAFT_114074 [Lindgomyces ingoldianus]
MSENKLEKSLDEILQDRRSKGRGRGGRRGRSAGRTATTQAPVGGVSKSTRQAKGNKAAPSAPTPATGDSKIMISNLPKDVDEITIKNYFTETIGKPKKVLLQYGPNGASLGSAIVIFPRPDLGAKAASELNGMSIDKRPIRVELLLSASAVPAIPQKSLADRVT